MTKFLLALVFVSYPIIAGPISDAEYTYVFTKGKFDAGSFDQSKGFDFQINYGFSQRNNDEQKQSIGLTENISIPKNQQLSHLKVVLTAQAAVLKAAQFSPDQHKLFFELAKTNFLSKDKPMVTTIDPRLLPITRSIKVTAYDLDRQARVEFMVQRIPLGGKQAIPTLIPPGSIREELEKKFAGEDKFYAMYEVALTPVLIMLNELEIPQVEVMKTDKARKALEDLVKYADEEALNTQVAKLLRYTHRYQMTQATRISVFNIFGLPDAGPSRMENVVGAAKDLAKAELYEYKAKKAGKAARKAGAKLKEILAEEQDPSTVANWKAKIKTWLSKDGPEDEKAPDAAPAP